MKNFIQPGDTITVPAPAAVSSGDGVLLGGLFGVAAFTAGSGDPLEIKTSGVFELPKTSAQAWTIGVPIYWDAGAATTDDDSGANPLIGHAVEAAANPSAIGKVRLI